MTSIPAWLIGKNVTVCNIKPLTIDAAGTISTAASNVDCRLQLDEISIELVNNTEVISGLDERQDNHVIVSSDCTITLVEILKRSGSNILAGIFMGLTLANADWVLVTITRGAQTFTFYGVMTRYSEGIRRGKSVGTLAISSINTVGVTNPAYA